MTSTVEAATSPLKGARDLMAAGQFAAAATQIDDLLAREPGNGDALYLRAACLRYLHQPQQALETLAHLLERDPENARAYQERGHTLLLLNRPEAAQQAYRQAVTLNPGLLASWKTLEGLGQHSGDLALANEARSQRLHLQRLPKPLLSVTSMMHEGRLYKAEQLCRSFLRQHPQDVEGMRLLAALGVKNGILDDAEFLLESALEFAPTHKLARLDYVNVLYRRQKFQQSLEQATALLESHPDDPIVESAYANQRTAVGDYHDALDIYQRLTQRLPGNPTLHLTNGHTLKTVGRLDDAIAAYRRAYGARGDFGDAYWSLANLKTYRFTGTEVAAMIHQAAAPATGLEDRIHFCFALGKHYEDAEDYAGSFDHYQRGNQLRKAQLSYSAEKTSQRFALQRATCTAELFRSRTGSGCHDSDPIFIVGLPRAGSTLLEQILASHSLVDGTMELQNITAIAQALDGRRRVDEPARYPANLGELAAEQLEALGRRYLDDTRIHRQGAPRFIDKLPNNFVHIGLIQLILPNATIIDARRHPMGCCFSNFKQLFASGQEYTYGLEEIGRYYRDYVELMDHWDAVLPGKVLRVQYEDVVADLEGQVRRLLDHCGLPFEDACIRFHETERSVRTPSSEQVRQPIFRSGIEQWRHFDGFLDPLKQALGPVLERYSISD